MVYKEMEDKIVYGWEIGYVAGKKHTIWPIQRDKIIHSKKAGQGPLTVWFQTHDIPEKAKLWGQWTDQCLIGVEVKEAWIGRAQGFSRQWNYSEYCCNGRYMLHIYSNHRMYNTKRKP